MDITTTVNSHFRTRANELAKGYYPTFAKDMEVVKTALDFQFGWDSRSLDEKRITLFDPCAGEGLFLNRIYRHARKSADGSRVKNAVIATYAVELDRERFEKIRQADQKLNSSFFDVTSTGGFDVVLLNPPYNRNTGELLAWIDKAAPLVAYHGVMVLIIPEYELKPELIALLRGSFSFRYAFRSEAHDAFKQVLVFLRRNQSNAFDPEEPACRYVPHRDNLDNTPNNPIVRYRENPLILTVRAVVSDTPRPLLQSRDMSGFYLECEARLEAATRFVLDKEYPSSYDTSVVPATTLRTAHAVQLAAMNSQVESVALNGSPYLAKYMVVTKAETTDSYHEGVKTQITVYKPTVETFLMDRAGFVKPAREMGFDYLELNTRLSTILLKRLTRQYRPLHEIGRDEAGLSEELKDLGLKPPQREAVKAVMKAYGEGRKGIGIRANTGTGKTWIAKAVKYLTGARRTIMVTEPQLVPQLVKEYENEGFAVHVIDSWTHLRELAESRPKGLYLISYTRLRMHPNFVPVTKTIKVRTREGLKYTQACVICRHPVDRITSGAKERCPRCGSALYTYVPENQRPPMSYRRWIRDIEDDGRSIEARTHNKQLPYIRYLKRIPFDLALFDEAHNAANLMSNQGTAFIRLAASARKVLCLTATVTNGMAKSLYNLLWGINPRQMKEAGWNMKSATEFQAKFGAIKEIRKTDERNRHRASERVTTTDTAGISPAALIYTLPNFINVDSEDFDDLPPVEREVIKCAPHPEVADCMRVIAKIIDDADLPFGDLLAAASVKTAAFLRVSDTFCHADDEIRLRGNLLGILQRRPVPGLLEKEEKLIDIVREALARKERVLVYTGNTQKIDMRGPIQGILHQHLPEANVDILPDSVAPGQLVGWFEKTRAQVVVASFHRVATGLNLSQFNNLIWFDYSDNTRLAEQGEGRIRRVNTADIHRAVFGEVRPVRYWYLTSSPIQEAQLAYTLEKRMIAKLAEGETPDIDPAECATGNQSFSALITKALKEGHFDYQDPSALLKKMTRAENAGVRSENFRTLTSSPVPMEETAPPRVPPQPEKVFRVIFQDRTGELEKELTQQEFDILLEQGLLDLTLFGIYCRHRAA